MREHQFCRRSYLVGFVSVNPCNFVRPLPPVAVAVIEKAAHPVWRLPDPDVRPNPSSFTTHAPSFSTSSQPAYSPVSLYRTNPAEVVSVPIFRSIVWIATAWVGETGAQSTWRRSHVHSRLKQCLPLCPFGDRRRDGRRLILGGEMSCGTALFHLEICDIRSAPRDFVRSDHEKFCGAAEGEKKFGYVSAFCEPIAVRRHTCIHVTGSSFDGEGSWPLEKGSATLS